MQIVKLTVPVVVVLVVLVVVIIGIIYMVYRARYGAFCCINPVRRNYRNMCMMTETGHCVEIINHTLGRLCFK